ncbi:MAG: hypothetical protein JWO03_2793 [Bacteroidetes bacterium]|nr:hypothetical protein [Bacteroidota bacterium]
MKKILFICTILAALFISGCKKSNETDYASGWVGVYNDPSSVPNSGVNTTAYLNNIIISSTGPSTLKIQIKAIETNYIYTYTTLKGVNLNGATVANIDEMDNLTEGTGQYHIKGTLTMTGTHVVLSATATNTASTKETDIKTLYFSGIKNQ